MELDVEDWYIDALNKIDLSIRKYSKWKTEYPSYFNSSTSALLNNLNRDKDNLEVILQTIKDSQVTSKKRLSLIRQLDLIIEQFVQDEHNKVTSKQGTMFKDYIFRMVAELLAKIIYRRQFFNSGSEFDRSPHSDFDYRPLCKILRSMKEWLNKNHNTSYIEFEASMGGHLDAIMNLSNLQKAA